MLKEILKKHGIEDSSIQEILKSMEESKVYITKEQNIDERYSKLKSQKIELDKIVADRDKQLEELKKNNSNNLELLKQIEDLKALNETSRTDYESKISKMEFDFALDKALSGAKCKNNKALKALLNMENLELKDGSINGLKEQLESLRENDSYLFEDTMPTNTGSTGSFANKANETGFNFNFNKIR